MGVSIGPIGLGGGGGVLGLGPAPNTFGDSTTADRAAAEALRDAQATADAAWLALYTGNLSFWIRLVWNGGVVEQRRNAAGTGWEDVTNVVRGRQGELGPQGSFFVRLFANGQADPGVPVGATYDVTTRAWANIPTGYAATPAAPTGLESTWYYYGQVNPSSGTGTVAVTLTAGGRFTSYGRQGGFNIFQYRNAATNPGTPTGGSYNVETGAFTPSTDWAAQASAPGTGEETFVSTAFINPEIQTGDVTPTWNYPYDHSTAFNLFTIVDVTGTGPPAASAATVPHLYLDTEIPRAWLTRTQRLYTTNPTGTFGAYTDANFIGSFRRVQDVPSFTADQFWYLHGAVHSWFQAASSSSAPQVSAEQVLGASATWLGDAPDADTALRRIDNFDNTRSYVFFNEGNDRVEVLDNGTFSAQTVTLTYEFVALDLETDVAAWAHAGDTSQIPADKLGNVATLTDDDLDVADPSTESTTVGASRQSIAEAVEDSRALITALTARIATLEGAGYQTQANVDSRITTQVKDFAQAGGRDVRVGDMDSESSTDGQVITSDGSGGAAWEDPNGGAPVSTLTRYCALAPSGTTAATATEAMFTGGGAVVETSTDNDIQTPDSNTAMVVLLGLPASLGILTAVAGLLGNGQPNTLASDVRSDFEPDDDAANQVTLNIGGASHYIYATTFNVLASALGDSGYRLTQTP